MELEKFDRQLRLLLLLSTEHSLTVDDISRKLDMSRRSIYRYIDAFRALGFVVHKTGTRYSIDSESPFFTHITKLIHFSREEAFQLVNLICQQYDPTPEMRALRDKLAALYDVAFLRRQGMDDRNAVNVARLFQAIREERVAVLHDYHSVSPNAVSDRVVEPFLFFSGSNEVRCYEMASGMNKTYSVDCIGSVEVLDLLWTHAADHRPYYTDLFHCAGEHQFRVKLLLGRRATPLLLHDYPAASDFLVLTDDGRYLLDVPVCSFAGVGRFVLGVFDDVTVLGGTEFATWLYTRIMRLADKADDEFTVR